MQSTFNENVIFERLSKEQTTNFRIKSTLNLIIRNISFISKLPQASFFLQTMNNNK